VSEFEAGHLPGALAIGAGDLPDRIDQLPRDRPIATICASGYRSSVAASLLRAAGFQRVSWVPGGVATWGARGFPLAYEGTDGRMGPGPPS
jgi:hydroxyacylglutathione hydrolase